MEVIDSHADLNAYAKIENQSGCCSPAPETGTATVEVGPCCTPAPAGSEVCCTPSKPVAEGEACCTTAEKVEASRAGASCCSPGPAPGANTPELLERLADLIRRYDVNDYAASVKVFAVKP